MGSKVLIKITLPIFCLFTVLNAFAQFGSLQWSADGNSYYEITKNGIMEVDAQKQNRKLFVSSMALTPVGQKPLNVVRFTLSNDKQKVLISTNTKKVWRYDTRGDYWVLDRNT